MIRYLILRLIGMLATLFFIVSLVFFITSAAMNIIWSPHGPFIDGIYLAWDQYISYLTNVFTQWDWGTTGIYRLPVWDVVLAKAPLTLIINLIVFFLYVTIGIALGIISAKRKHSFTDKTISVVTLMYSSLPSFILIFPLIVVLGFRWGIVPWRYPLYLDGFAQMVGLLIPLLALSGQPIATLTRAVRAELLENFDSEYYLLAKTKGLKTNQRLYRHALRNSMVPILPQIPAIFAVVLLNSFFVEVVYNVPGVAKLFLDSMYQPMMDTGYFDIQPHVVTVIACFYAIIHLSITLIMDVSLAFVDPRIQIIGKQ